MPQLDVSTYMGQLFWLLLTFTLLLALMTYSIVPKLERIFTRREREIRVLLDQAEAAQREAQSLMQLDQEKLQEARLEAQQKIRMVVEKLRQEKELHKQDMDHFFQQKLSEVDQQFHLLKKQALQEAVLLKGELVEALFQKIKGEKRTS